MKYFLLFFTLSVQLLAFDISIKSGKEDGETYSVLSLSSQQVQFKCSENLDEFMNVVSIECEVPRSFSDDINDIKHPLLFLEFDKERDSFKLTVTSAVKIKLFATSKPFYQQTTLNYFDKEFSHNWIIVAYDKKLPFIAHKSYSGMKFPIPRDFDAMPAVGPVDINSLPVASGTSVDVEHYVKLEKRFEKGDYKEALRVVRELQKKFPDSIFYSDFIRYEMKILEKLGIEDNFDDIVQIGKRFIRNYTSDEYLPEVLLMMAKAYADTGFMSDANYFFDRLINEHSDSYYGGLGKIEFGLYRYRNDDKEGGIQTILDTFYSTKYIDVATKAADALADIYLSTGDREEAAKYIETIWDNQKEYLTDDRAKLLRYAEGVEKSQKHLQLALKMYEQLLKLYDKNLHDEYSKVLYKIALTNDKMKNYKEAYRLYEKYLDEFPYGDYEQQAKEALDMLLIKQDSENVDEKLKNLDELIEKNSNENIGKEAIVAKLEVLNTEGLFARSIQMHDKVELLSGDQYEKAKELLDTAFYQHITTLLESQSCSDIDYLIRAYELELDSQRYDDRKLFECYFEVARYESAQAIAQKYLNDEDLEQRAYWLCKLAKIKIVQREYAIARDIYNDIFALDQAEVCKDIYIDLFETQKQLKDTQGMVQTVQEIEKRQKGAKLLEIYKDLVQTVEQEDIKKVYIQKMLQLQQSLAIDTFSPWLELQAARYLESSQELIEALNGAVQRAKTEQKARIYFELGNAHSDLGNDEAAVTEYERCIEIESMWQSLCEDAKSLITD